MRLTRLMGLAVVLVAMATAMNALAFKTATVNNPTSMTVVATNSAIFAFAPIVSTATGFSTSVSANGQLTIGFVDDMQPNSEYLYEKVFKVSSNVSRSSVAKDIAITGISIVDAATGAAVTGVSAEVLLTGTSTSLVGQNVNAAGTEVDVKVVLGSTAAVGGKSLLIKVSGTEQP